MFGHINQVPLDPFYKKSLFVSVAQLKSEFESRYTGKKKFQTFIMPVLILALRIEIEVIFKNTFQLFFLSENNTKVGIF